MAKKQSYEQQFRTLGQILEKRHLSVFKLLYDNDVFTIHGKPDKDTSLKGTVNAWRQAFKGEKQSDKFQITAKELEREDRTQRMTRAKLNRLPDFYSLSNIMRTIGAHLDAQGVELLELRKRPLNVSIVTKNRDGYPELEERTVASFHTLFLKLHGKRQLPNHKAAS